MMDFHEGGRRGLISELIITDQEFEKLANGQTVITRNDLPRPPRVGPERIILHHRNKDVIIVGVEEIGIGNYRITLQDAGPEKK